jgi:hypothetical protein
MYTRVTYESFKLFIVVLIKTSLVWVVLVLSVGPQNGHRCHHHPRYSLNIETDTSLC